MGTLQDGLRAILKIKDKTEPHKKEVSSPQNLGAETSNSETKSERQSVSNHQIFEKKIIYAGESENQSRLVKPPVKQRSKKFIPAASPLTSVKKTPPRYNSPRPLEPILKPGLPVNQVASKEEPSLELCIDRVTTVALRQTNSFELLDLSGSSFDYQRVVQANLSRSSTVDVSLGVDIGTSTAKVCVHANDRTYPVPFMISEGVERYTLPARVYRSRQEGKYNLVQLDEDDETFDDLKLSFLGQGSDVAVTINLVAFITLVFKQTLSWIYRSEVGKSLSGFSVFWDVRLGFPASSMTQSQLLNHYQCVAKAAWYLTTKNAYPSKVQIEKSLDPSNSLKESLANTEIQVIPELAAQISGFVASERFSNSSSNNFFMIDIGAGTIDLSVFHVQKGRGGKQNIVNYYSDVVPLGVANLHRFRVDWWMRQLRKHGMVELSSKLLDLKFSTDTSVAIPNSFTDYFIGINVRAHGGAKFPDQDFFSDVMKRVRTALVQVRQQNLLDMKMISDTKLLLVGGGSLMPYYDEIAAELQRTKNATYMRLERYYISRPRDLVTDTIANQSYHRLSVAYGLSRIRPGALIEGKPMSRISGSDSNPDFGLHYRDKDAI